MFNLTLQVLAQALDFLILFIEVAKFLVQAILFLLYSTFSISNLPIFLKNRFFMFGL